MRAALNAVVRSAPEWLARQNRPDWAERYGARVEQYRLPKGEAARQALGEAIGADGHDLLAALFAETQRFWLCRLPAVERLRIIWIQQFYHDQGRVRWRRPVDQPPVNQRLHSPYDPDARYAKKRDTSWIGYKVHLTETCEADRPNLITDVQTTAAGTPDGAMTATVQSALAGRGLLPETHVVDAGYVDAALLVASQVDHAIDLLGPVALDHGWRAHSEQGFDLSAFTIVWPDRVAHCPAGQTSRDWSETCDKRGTPLVHITCARRHLRVSAAAPAAWLSAANLSMKLCRRVASSRKARSGRNDIPVVPGSKALCHRAFGASDCAAAVMLDTPKPTSSTSSPQQPSTSPASTHGSMATFGHKRDSQNSPPWSQMPHEVNVGK
jgi:transposase